MSDPIVLASRSPRRMELLRQMVPESRILVCPPPSSDEAGFEGLTSIPEIIARLMEISAHKHSQTEQTLRAQRQRHAAIIAGDTVVVVQEPDGRKRVLGQPPPGPDFDALVRHWFTEYYAGREHQVLTGVTLSVTPPGDAGLSGNLAMKSFVVTTCVRFTDQVEHWLDWYLATGESAGKAGGYAIQGAGSLFVDQVTGSLSNVVGLPLREVQAALWELGLDVNSL